ncbi:MAG: MBL fold metallo-hydrolase [Anaerolineae bacterium]|nr:MBL fold metallo-hydrolase [Anaerolineae bacterium]
MSEHVTIITTPFMFNVAVNCYLVRAEDGFVLIDTGRASKRRDIEQALARAGCQSGNLKLIVLTHGDFDHCGNAAYLRQKFGARLAMHEADAGMIERGDMAWNRPVGGLSRLFFSVFMRLARADRVAPDCFLAEGDDLIGHGLDARVIELPGHSSGSIGLLTGAGDLFCGDLLANTDRPALWSIIVDDAAAQASVAKLKSLPPTTTVYPGHGGPFLLADFLADLPASQEASPAA